MVNKSTSIKLRSSDCLSEQSRQISNQFRERTAQAEREFEQNIARRLTFADKQKIEKIIAFDLAHENNLWVDDIYTLGKIFQKGNENTVLLNEYERVVYKCNNLMNSFGKISTLFDIIESHNQLFYEVPYEIIGFTGIDNGAKLIPHIEVILKQPFVYNAEHATPNEIANYMQSIAFRQINIHTFENDNYIVYDLHPRNVLKNLEGNIFVIDNRIETKNNYKLKEKNVLLSNNIQNKLIDSDIEENNFIKRKF